MCTHANKQKGNILAYLLEGGSLALYRRFGPHLQLLAQCHQFLHLCHHQSLFLINQLEQRERQREEMSVRTAEVFYHGVIQGRLG